LTKENKTTSILQEFVRLPAESAYRQLNTKLNLKMIALTTKQIYEIAQEFDCGNRCYLKIKTGEIISTPDFELNFDDGKEFYEEILEELENNWDDYVEIEKPHSSDSYEFMLDFAEQLEDDNKLKSKLFEALKKNKPFRRFMFEIDNSGKHRQEWFDFKQAKLESWVIEKLNEIKID